MPCYKWKGINLFGMVQKGKLRALSKEVLERELLARDIGLLAASEKKSFFSTIKDSDILFLFKRLESLLSAGVYLHDALSLLASKVHSSSLADTLEDVALEVEQGRLLHEALAKYPRIFESLLVEVFRVGSEGNILSALSLMSSYLEQRAVFKKKLRRAAFMPALTGIFFITIFIGMLLFIIPRFDHMFSSLRVDVPAFTRGLLKISKYIQDVFFFYTAMILLGLILVLRLLLNTKKGLYLWHSITISTPYVRYFVIEREKLFFFNALGLLLKAGLPLVSGIRCALNVVQNSRIKSDLEVVYAHVRDGQSMSYACEQLTFIDEELTALLAVGERSGRFASLIGEVANVSRDRLMQRISFLTIIIQPLLLIILACSVAGLMLAVYIPLLTLSYAVG